MNKNSKILDFTLITFQKDAQLQNHSDIILCVRKAKHLNEHILPGFCCRQNRSVFLNTLCSHLIRLINIKILICTGSVSLHSKLVKWQEASRGISLSRIYSAFKCLSNYKKSTIVFSLTHNQIMQELLTPREDSAAFYISLRWHMTSTIISHSRIIMSGGVSTAQPPVLDLISLMCTCCRCTNEGAHTHRALLKTEDCLNFEIFETEEFNTASQTLVLGEFRVYTQSKIDFSSETW